MRKLAIAAVLIVIGASSSRAANGHIAPYFDAGAYWCQTPIPCGCSATLYVFGLLAGASANGITGAEYKIQPSSNTEGWLFTETFDPSATVLGSGALPSGGTPWGVNVAWPSCQQSGSGRVLLETVRILNAGCSTSQIRLTVVKRDAPSNQLFQCPLFTLCDAPVYTAVCVGSNVTTCQNPEPPFANNAQCSTSGQAWINPIPGFWCVTDEPAEPLYTCTIAVEPESWSRVKSLYRD